MTGAVDYRIPGSRCCNCHKLMDGATGVTTEDERSPQEGDIGLCMYCGHINAYGPNLVMRELNDEEIRDCAGNPDLLRAQAISAEFRKRRLE